MSEFEGITPNLDNINKKEGTENYTDFAAYGFQDGVPSKKCRKKSDKKNKKLKKAIKASKKKYNKCKKRFGSMEEEIKLLKQDNMANVEQLNNIRRYLVQDCMDKLVKSESESERRRLASALLSGGKNDERILY